MDDGQIEHTPEDVVEDREVEHGDGDLQNMEEQDNWDMAILSCAQSMAVQV